MIRRLLLAIVCLWSASASASVVLNATFASDDEGFSAGSRQSTEGANGTTGYLQVPSNTTASKSFTAISSGVFRCDFWTRVNDTDTAANNTKDCFIYLLPTSGTVASSNSVTTICVLRNTTASAASASAYHITYRNSDGGFYEINADSTTLAQPTYRGPGWLKISVVADFATDKFDLYLNDVLMLKGKTWANASAADFSRVVVLTSASAPAQDFDELLIQDSYSLPSEIVLIDHDFTASSGEIETLEPTTDNRNLYAQKWLIPADTSNYGAFTAGANGLTPDATLNCQAVYRGRADGVIECEFRSAPSGNIWMGFNFRLWEGYAAGGCGVVRIFGSSTNTIALILPSATGTQSQVASAALTPSADTTYTIKIEMRGRVYVVSYKAAAMDSGSYTVAFTHTVTSSATGGRGLLAEEYFGPFHASSSGATTNYTRRIRFTGSVPADEAAYDTAEYEARLGYGCIGEIYFPNAGDAESNIFHSRGIQFGHRSRGDMGNRYTDVDTVYSATNVKSYRQRGPNLTEYEQIGWADCYVTFLRRGPWVADSITAAGATENFAPDLDLRVGKWSGNYKTLGPTGTSVSSLTDTAYHTWRIDINDTALPAAVQRVTSFGSGDEMRMSYVVRNHQNMTQAGSSCNLTHKLLGNVDPISHAVDRATADMAHGTTYEVGRAFLFQNNQSALDDATLIDFRDDVKTPATISTFTTGSLKTDAAGDIGTDGFNDRHGWYEINCSGGTASFTFPVASGTRFMPAFRLNSWTSTYTVVTIAGSAGVAGTDYWLDDLGDGNALLQLNSNRTGNTTIALSQPEGGNGLLRTIILLSQFDRQYKQQSHFDRYGVYSITP